MYFIIPFAFLGPHLFYQVHTYFPRHIIQGYLFMVASTMLINLNNKNSIYSTKHSYHLLMTLSPNFDNYISKKFYSLIIKNGWCRVYKGNFSAYSFQSFENKSSISVTLYSFDPNYNINLTNLRIFKKVINLWFHHNEH